jgi:hypothetical protein
MRRDGLRRVHFTFWGSPPNLNPNLNLNPRLKIKSKIRIKIKKSEKTVPKYEMLPIAPNPVCDYFVPSAGSPLPALPR